MANTLKDRLRQDLNAVRRERDRLRTMLLTMTLSEVKNREIELGREATDEDVVEVVTRAVKRRREAAEQMRAGGRSELAEKEEREASLLTAYLPAQLDEVAVRALVRELKSAGATAVGPLMAQLVSRIKGRYDARDANRIVREELG